MSAAYVASAQRDCKGVWLGKTSGFCSYEDFGKVSVNDRMIERVVRGLRFVTFIQDVASWPIA